LIVLTTFRNRNEWSYNYFSLRFADVDVVVKACTRTAGSASCHKLVSYSICGGGIQTC